MRARFGLFSLVWLLTAYAAAPEWRVLALAAVGAVGAWALRSLWLEDLPTLIRGRDWLLGAGVGLAMALVTGPAYRLVAGLVPALQPEVLRLYGQMALTERPLALPPLFAVVVLEELVWRGAAFRLGFATSAWATALVATLLYAAAQGGLLSPVVVLVALTCGGAWSALRLRTGGLAAPIACHGVWNLAIFVLFPLEGSAG